MGHSPSFSQPMLPPMDHAPREAGRRVLKIILAGLQTPPIAIPMQTTPMLPLVLATPIATRPPPFQMLGPRPLVLATPIATRDRPTPVRRPLWMAMPIAIRERPTAGAAAAGAGYANRNQAAYPNAGAAAAGAGYANRNQGLDHPGSGWRGPREPATPTATSTINTILAWGPGHGNGNYGAWGAGRGGGLWATPPASCMGHGLTDVRLGILKL